MQTKLVEFLLELSDLLEKYGIDMEAVDDDADYYPSVSGIDVDISGDHEVDPPQIWESVTLPKQFNGNDLKRWIESQQPLLNR